jgi:hypothetical protein
VTAGDISRMGREERRLLLAELLAKRSARPRRFPLSFAQERLWFLEQMQPGGSAYHVGTALRIDGPLRPSLIEAALREVGRSPRRIASSRRSGSPPPSSAPLSTSAADRCSGLPFCSCRRAAGRSC